MDTSSTGSGGGAWKTVKRERKDGKSLIAKARAAGKNAIITLASNPEPIDPMMNEAMKDEDVSMGFGSSRSKSKKRFTPYGNRRMKKNADAKMDMSPEKRVDVLIAGFEPNTESNLIPYLKKKSKKIWDPIDVKFDQGQMLLTVEDGIIAHSIVRLNGYSYGQTQLQIRLFNDPTPEVTFTTTPEATKDTKLTTIDSMRLFLRSRWIPETRFLNLDNMAADPILKKASIKPPGVRGSNEFVGPTLMKLASEMFEDIQILSLAENRLVDVRQISSLAQFLPTLKKLSFKDNLISSYESIKPLSGSGKLDHLEELLLTGNPLRESELKQRGNLRGYMMNIIQLFPSLKLLDFESVDLTPDEVVTVLKKANILSVKILPSFFENEHIKIATTTFIQQYLSLFDTNRPALSVFYDNSATFSVTTNLKIQKERKVRRKEKKQMMEDDSASVTWGYMNRNLVLSKNTKTPGAKLIQGKDDIVFTITRLPKTFHDLTSPDDFVMDGVQTPSGLMVSLHGEFKQDSAGMVRFSFDRNFLLGPSTDVSTGLPFKILCDMLCVRDHAGNKCAKDKSFKYANVLARYESLAQSS
ncbi:hypothetical protein CLU79DRAFT_692572 [Phycomyces nitens]|nr:hypothetical protein CLU79DRAFT_692572 [Phycomyces nitens]